MVSCKLVEFLYDCLPFAGLRSLLLRLHVEGCPRCERDLISRDQARTLFIGSERLEADHDLWRRIRSRREMGEGETAGRTGRGGLRLRLEWVAGSAGFLFLAIVSFWLLKSLGENGAAPSWVPPGDRFAIEYVNVGGVPAEAYVYQPGDSDMIFVWAEKSDQGG